MHNSIAQKIKELREKFMYSLQDLADIIGVTKQSIHKFETGIVNPSNDTLIKIAEAFNVSFSYFFESSYSFDIKLRDIKFREKEKRVNKQLELEVKEEVCKYLANVLELENIMGTRLSFENPLEGVTINSDKDVEKAAKTLRKKWKIGNAPIQDVVETLENRGIYVIEVERVEDFTGLCGMVNDEFPIIVLNDKCPNIERKRFTALHELGHLVLDFSDDLSNILIEKFCDKFAGAVLLVDEILYEEIGKSRTVISLVELRRIKETYGISIQAIIMRATDIGLISHSTSRAWWNLYNEWNHGENKTTEFGSYKSVEKPKLFLKLLVRGINEKRLSVSKAAELTGKKVDTLKRELSNELTFNLN